MKGHWKNSLVLGAALGAFACGGAEMGSQVEAWEAAPAVELSAMTETSSGLHFLDITVGEGEEAVIDRRVTVHYSGWFLDGEKFDASVDRGEPYSFLLGQGRVISGWDQGVAGMRIGGHRRLVIPPELAYGAGGRPGIPPNSTLVFDVELLGVGG